jgi:hypothetical protein
MNFYYLLAEKSNLKSVQLNLNSQKTTAVEIIDLTRTELVMGTLKFQQVTL